MHADAGKRFLSLDKTSALFIMLLKDIERVSIPAIETGGFLFARVEGPDMDGLRAVAVALLVCAATLGVVSIGATQEADGPAMSVQQAENTSERRCTDEEGDRDCPETVHVGPLEPGK